MGTDTAPVMENLKLCRFHPKRDMYWISVNISEIWRHVSASLTGCWGFCEWVKMAHWHFKFSEWINNFVPHFTVQVITYACCNYTNSCFMINLYCKMIKDIWTIYSKSYRYACTWFCSAFSQFPSDSYGDFVHNPTLAVWQYEHLSVMHWQILKDKRKKRQYYTIQLFG